MIFVFAVLAISWQCLLTCVCVSGFVYGRTHTYKYTWPTIDAHSHAHTYTHHLYENEGKRMERNSNSNYNNNNNNRNMVVRSLIIFDYIIAVSLLYVSFYVCVCVKAGKLQI